MEIGGLVPFTLTDYPGKVAAVVFTQGCNFSCPYCHNSGLIPRVPADPGALERLFSFLDSRRQRLSGVVVSGGEPTIHQDLPWFLKEIRGLGFSVKLDTNGGMPGMLEEIVGRGLADFIAMDVKAPRHKYAAISGEEDSWERVSISMRLIASSGIPHLFRTTVVPGLLDEQDLKEISASIPEGSAHVFQQWRRPGSPVQPPLQPSA